MTGGDATENLNLTKEAKRLAQISGVVNIILTSERRQMPP
jgi:hypothetical protein